MSCQTSDFDLPFQAEAFELAMRELGLNNPEAVKQDFVVDVLMDAVLSLSRSGQTNIEMLSRYAASRGAAAWQIRGAKA